MEDVDKPSVNKKDSSPIRLKAVLTSTFANSQYMLES